MKFAFNPLTGGFDLVGQGISALNVKGSVADVASLPGGANVGDVYLVTADAHFYVWDGTEWDDLGTLQGPAGADGADGVDGRTILNGSGAPSAGLGEDGDFYLDTTATAIYGPKTAGAWGSPTSLIGPKGDKGDQGDPGVGVPAGGTTGQALIKSSGTDYDADWGDLPTRTTSAAGVLPATSYAAITYAATVNLDLAALDGQYRTISLTGDLTLTTSNRATGRTTVIRIIADASQRTLTFPTDWKFLGTKPANIAASKTGVLSLTFFGTADSDCVAAWGVQG